jgi:hypothetical protein
MLPDLLFDAAALQEAFRQLLEIQLLASLDPEDHAGALQLIRDDLFLHLQQADLGPDPVTGMMRRALLADGLDAAVNDLLAVRDAA